MGYAITTRYAGPTNSRGSRVIATGPAITSDDAREGRYTRATVSWDYGAGNEHRGHDDGIVSPLCEACVNGFAGWGYSDANHRRAADAVVARLRAAGWDVSLAPDDRGATLPREDGNVYVLEYGRVR